MVKILTETVPMMDELCLILVLPKKVYVGVPVRKLRIVSVLLEDCVLVREAEENELCGGV